MGESRLRKDQNHDPKGCPPSPPFRFFRRPRKRGCLKPEIGKLKFFFLKTWAVGPAHSSRRPTRECGGVDAPGAHPKGRRHVAGIIRPVYGRAGAPLRLPAVALYKRAMTPSFITLSRAKLANLETLACSCRGPPRDLLSEFSDHPSKKLATPGRWPPDGRQTLGPSAPVCPLT